MIGPSHGATTPIVVPKEKLQNAEQQAILARWYADRLAAQERYDATVKPYVDKHQPPPDDVQDTANRQCLRDDDAANKRRAQAMEKLQTQRKGNA